MKIVVVAALAALFGATSALAADLPAPIYTKAPAVVDPGTNWSGFYLGGNVGYSWGRSSETSGLSNGTGAVLFSNAASSKLDGVVGGGQIGYNWQMQNWLWGLEADIQGTDEKGSRGFTCDVGVCTQTIPGIRGRVTPGPAVPVALNQKIDWFGTVRGRLGILATPTLLFYATGGLAYGEVASNGTVGAALSPFSASNTKAGYTVGAGIEGAIGGNWTAKLEYLYVDLGRVSGTFATTIPALGSGTLSSSYSSRITDNVLRVGLNYRFAGPGLANY